MSKPAKKPLRVKIQKKSKLYVPFFNNNLAIAYLNKKRLSEITSDSSNLQNYENPNNIIPSKYQVIPASVSNDFKQILENSILSIVGDVSQIDNLSIDKTLELVVIYSKLIDKFPDINNIEKLRQVIKKLEDINKTTKINNIESLVNLKRDVLKIKNKLEQDLKNIGNVETKLKLNNDPILYTNPIMPNRLNLESFILNNRKNFQEFINTRFNDSSKSHTRNSIKKWNNLSQNFNDIFPFSHQKFVSDYLSDNTPYRGLLLYHGLGSGKSGASILIGEGFIKRRVVILLPASIRDNYVGEINTFGEVAYKTNFHWVFIKLPKVNSTVEARYRELLADKGIKEDLYNKIIKNLKKNELGIEERGIWLIDYTRDRPNYSELDSNSKVSLDKQISTMFNYKYTICHYNAGQYTLTKILEKLLPEYNTIYSSLFGSRKISTLSNRDRDTLLNYIYKKSNNIENPFSNKVLIVDEIHNLTSSMAGNSYNAGRLYEMIMRATNLKIVFLSGTPVINYPYELALMFNMLKGFMKVYSITLVKNSGIFNKLEVENHLKSLNLVDRFEIRGKLLKLIRNPFGFTNKYSKIDGSYEGVEQTGDNIMDDDSFIDTLRTFLQEIDYSFSVPVVTHSTIFPDILDKRNYDKSIMLGNNKYLEIQQALFNESYIRDNRLINGENFMNRTIGLISFYNEISSPEGEEDIFPEKIEASSEETSVHMSDYQFIEYASKRDIERELENSISKRSKNSDVDVNQKIPNLFKVFSRQKGIFVFPPHIERPKPPKKRDNLIIKETNKMRDDIRSKLKEIIKDSNESNIYTNVEKYISSLEDDIKELAIEIFRKSFNIEGETIEEYKEYLESIDFGDSSLFESQESSLEEVSYMDACIDAISRLSKENLTINSNDKFNLSVLSPKYLKMLQNINNSPGLSFIYSQFRSVEGIEIFARVLLENGYTRITISEGTIVQNNSIEVGKRVRYLDSVNKICKTYIVDEINNPDLTIVDEIGNRLVVPITNVGLCKFALWTGSENPEDRNIILNYYNSIQNMWGYQCQVLMTTQSGAEGISLKFVRQVHIMEPYWNNVRINQVIGRARRIKSHMELPLKDRNVTIFNYVIKYTAGQISGTWTESIDRETVENVQGGEENNFDLEQYDEEQDIVTSFKSFGMELSNNISTLDGGLTSDEVLVDISTRKENILNQFLDLMKRVSVDCIPNKIDNIRSNSRLESLTCYPTSSTFSNSGSSYIYSITTQDIVSDTLSVSSGQSKNVKYKRLIVPFKVKVSADKQIDLKFITIIPMSIEGFAQIPDNTLIYDYYIYNGFNPERIGMESQLLPIGHIENRVNPIPRFSKEFISRLPLYKKIQQILNTIYNETSEIEKNDVKSKLFERLNKSNTWKCIVCNQEYPDSTNSCSKPECSGITRDMSLKHLSKTSSQGSASTSTSQKSITIKKRRRRKKNN